MVGQNI